MSMIGKVEEIQTGFDCIKLDILGMNELGRELYVTETAN